MKEGRHIGKRNAENREASEPERVIRASVVERGRRLLANPSYPGIDEAREVARILLPML